MPSAKKKPIYQGKCNMICRILENMHIHTHNTGENIPKSEHSFLDNGNMKFLIILNVVQFSVIKILAEEMRFFIF